MLVLALCGCAGAPGMYVDESIRQIAWTRTRDAVPFRDGRGVCHVFSADTPEAMEDLGAQVKACFDRTLPASLAPVQEARSIKVAWQLVSVALIDALFALETAQGTPQAMASAKTAPMFSVRGFYSTDRNVCRIIVSDRPDYLRTVGHEFKHCADGRFHDERGVWR